MMFPATGAPMPMQSPTMSPMGSLVALRAWYRRSAVGPTSKALPLAIQSTNFSWAPRCVFKWVSKTFRRIGATFMDASRRSHSFSGRTLKLWYMNRTR